ncbi:hypothetical protein TNCV_1361101 [Trichonephila clavipes]|nr:hypothetical protein TNCV_1361101 [Trichonephila clavipes]
MFVGVAHFKITTGNDYLMKDLNRFGLADSPACPLYNAIDMCGDHLIPCSRFGDVTYLSNAQAWLLENLMLSLPVRRQSDIHRVQCIGAGGHHLLGHSHKADRPLLQPGQTNGDILPKSHVRRLKKAGNSFGCNKTRRCNKYYCQKLL